MNNNIIIGVDLDDTVENLVVAWVKWLDKVYNLSVKPEEITAWAFHEFFPTLTRDQVYAPLYIDEFWDTVQIKPDAVHYLTKLYNEGFQIYICTNSNSKTLDTKLNKIVYRHFPFIDSHHIIVTANKQLIKLNILVDDNPENLIGADYLGILLDASHNQWFSSEEYIVSQPNNKPIVRAKDWQKVYRFIHSYASKNGWMNKPY